MSRSVRHQHSSGGLTMNVYNTALMEYLKINNTEYFGKVQEVRSVVEEWLSYVPATFPHFTSHTIKHSEEIILQLSNLMFRDGDPQFPVLKYLSSTEVFILIMSAYLHDVGMVVSDKVKIEILESDEWRLWTTGEGGGSKRWQEIQQFRKSSTDAIKQFLADRQTRFLIAEFLRNSHHTRSALVIEQHQTTLGRFAFDDPVLIRTISNVCASHGYEQYRLEDKTLFPDRSDIRGDKVNVRFLAIMLRIGDLLDMSHDRACPLLLNAACPLPPDSYAHWSKYKCITHRSVEIDRIEITAECINQEEHRQLRDWCTWLEKEVTNAAVIMQKCKRHNDWTIPEVKLGKTIVIKPHAQANYIPCDWKFELDHDTVIKRLVTDIYTHPLSFIRELIQNALDAIRCQIYNDLPPTMPHPEYPTQISEDIREQYPLKFGIFYRDITNELSGEIEKKQYISIEDCGIGMDSEIISKYLLQVGRSYYTSDEFRRSFSFSPTSRFGLGFLSVFAVSDHVSIDTYKPSSSNNDGPIELILTGPKNYLLVQKGTKNCSGTTIEIMLKNHEDIEKIIDYIIESCKKVEIPIVVQTDQDTLEIRAEKETEFCYEIPDYSVKDAIFKIRSFPIQLPGIDGYMYVFVRIDKYGESWVSYNYAKNHYPLRCPNANIPVLPSSITCFHGIRTESTRTSDSKGWSLRIDIRANTYQPTLSRNQFQNKHFNHTKNKINEAVISILKQHLESSERAKGPTRWMYCQKLAEIFPFYDFWNKCPGTLRIFLHFEETSVSLDVLKSELIISIVIISKKKSYKNDTHYNSNEILKRLPQSYIMTNPHITFEDLSELDDEFRNNIFQNRAIDKITFFKDCFVSTWTLNPPSTEALKTINNRVSYMVLPNSHFVGIETNKSFSGIYEHIVLNISNPFIKWLSLLQIECAKETACIAKNQFETALNLLCDAIRYSHNLVKLEKYLATWTSFDIPAQMLPPKCSFMNNRFGLSSFPDLSKYKEMNEQKNLEFAATYLDNKTCTAKSKTTIRRFSIKDRKSTIKDVKLEE